jgi:hypothetical protein
MGSWGYTRGPSWSSMQIRKGLLRRKSGFIVGPTCMVTKTRVDINMDECPLM